MKRWLTVLAACLVSAIAEPARAQEPAHVREAVTLAHRAKQNYDVGDWAGALELFAAAEAKAHSPVLLLYMARCHRNLGHFLRARSIYARAATEALTAGAPDPFVAARADAQRDHDALVARIPKVTFELGVLPRDSTVHVDGAELPRERVSKPFEIDPGPHVARALSGSDEIARADFRVEEGQSIRVRLAPHEGPRSGPTELPPRPPPRRYFVPAAIALGLGAVGAGVGVGTRVLAFETFSEVKRHCVGNHCPASDTGAAADVEGLQTASTISLVTGGVFLATGVVLLWVRPGERKESKVALRASPTWLELGGTF